MIIKSLGSSSLGNCYYLEIERKERPAYKILLDVGLEKKLLQERAIENGIDLSTINAVVISHEHLDHCVSVPYFNDLGVLIFAPYTVIEKFKLTKNAVELIEFKTQLIASGIKIFSFPLEHFDSPEKKVYNLGYIIVNDLKESLLYVTDTKYITYDLSRVPFTYILIEANYMNKLAQTIIYSAKKKGDNNTLMKYKRLVISHMNIENCVKTLNTFNLEGCRAIFLIHHSAETQHYLRFKEYAKEKIKKPEIPIYVFGRIGNIY